MKVYISNPFHLAETRIYIVDDSSNRKKLLSYSDGIWRADDLEEGTTDQKPSIVLPSSISHELMKAMADAFSNQGIRPDSNAVLEGELKATKEHLADMRKLVFEVKP